MRILQTFLAHQCSFCDILYPNFGSFNRNEKIQCLPGVTQLQLLNLVSICANLDQHIRALNNSKPNKIKVIDLTVL